MYLEKKRIEHIARDKLPFRNANWISAPYLAETPLRSELYSADQMATYGKSLAASHQLGKSRGSDFLLSRLASNEEILVHVCGILTLEVAAKRSITPAGGWLLDNFYLIEEQIRTAKRHLPKGYSRELPCLIQGSSANIPRVYDIALEAISHGDGRIDMDSFGGFITAYQTETHLKLGELWAIPIMLRLAIIENLRRVAVRIATRTTERNLAGNWAEQMIATAEVDPKNLILLIADMARSNPPIVSAFVAELVRRLQGRGPALALPLTWIEQQLSESGSTIEHLVQLENQQQAADQVSISNSIGSLRTLGAVDWRTFVEAMSVVEHILSSDIVYKQMDFASRDRYRHAVEAIAKQGQFSEGEVAQRAVELATQAIDERAQHVGYFLIDQGLSELEKKAEVRFFCYEIWCRKAGAFSQLAYLGGIALVTIFFTALFAQVDALVNLSWGVQLLIAILFVIAVSQLAITFVNWLVMRCVTPRPLPRMDYSKGIPSERCTLVVVPCMLSSERDIEELIEQMEVRFLANRDDQLRFGLLTDWLDAEQLNMANDDSLLELAHQRVQQLNRKYAQPTQNMADVFFLFHRARQWNEPDQVWMGYERKRGKLASLNAFLRSDRSDYAASGFVHLTGDTAALAHIKYVITLDRDTQMPRDAARQLVATMAHPLNQPQYDQNKRRVIAGYGILQPRVAVSLPTGNTSRYAKLYGGINGIDPYTLAVSDVYQDLFGEGSFIGKGIYDVDAFELSIHGGFPENSILSHDLLEGCHARAGLISDVQLFEDYPAQYRADVSRRYRWIRGDWQLAAWLLRHTPCQTVSSQKNPLSILSQWKIVDNLRRSLVPAALLLFLLLSWCFSFAWQGTLAVLLILLLAPVCASTLNLLNCPKDVRWRQHIACGLGEARLRLLQSIFDVSCLPYQAFYSLEAIGRTAWRMSVSHRSLLEWNPSGAESNLNFDQRRSHENYWRSMWIGPVLALASGLYLAFSSSNTLLFTAPILLLWVFSPSFAQWISLPIKQKKSALTLLQMLFLRMIARRTWAFFDRFVGAADHWLPPDNYQEYRQPAIAHRTSPTNMGLSLLANLTAYDFGYLSMGRLLERTQFSMATMLSLERFRGHFYNWYDTQTLQVLQPIYVSTVDSGNLAGHLMTLRAGLLALVDDKVVPIRLFHGLSDTLNVFVSVVPDAAVVQVLQLKNHLASLLGLPPNSLTTMQNCLAQLCDSADQLVLQSQATEESNAPLLQSEAHIWATALALQCREAFEELLFLNPWLVLSAAPAGVGEFASVEDMLTVRELANLAAHCPSYTRRQETGVASIQQDWLQKKRQYIEEGSNRANVRINTIEKLVQQLDEMVVMDYKFLFDPSRHLLSIGYNVAEQRRDTSFYDLLASEARLCCFVAIAQGQIPQESWFALGRLLTNTSGAPVLLSWSGSMFEYLMPQLVMPNFDNTLLDQTSQSAVARQIEYGTQRNVPWGISESGYNTVDVNLNYQYRAFGVPGLGLKRGLGDDLVIAPYASALALMVAPDAACLNLQRLANEEFLGQYGFYEAIDYTPVRQRRGQRFAVVHAYMAHHQGMSLLALSYLILDRPMQRRFMSDRLFQSVMLLLQERIPSATALFSHVAERFDLGVATPTAETPIRIFTQPNTATPEVQLLSNGRYHVMVNNAGSGYSRWKDLSVTRWVEDSSSDQLGVFCYIRDVPSGEFWSTSYQPTLKMPATYEAIFTEGRAEFRRSDLIRTNEGQLDTHTEIVVSPEDDIELRRVRITNRSRQRREIDVTSYAEVVLASAASDTLHPAFSKLFVQTEILPDQHAILCTRRPRALAEQDQAPWMLHLMMVHGGEVGVVSYETDRSRFIGRTRTVASPLAMTNAVHLANTQGSVLDPIVAIRQQITLNPGQSVTINMVTGAAENRSAALGLIAKYQDRHLAERVFDLAWTHSQVVLRQLNASELDAQMHSRLAGMVIYASDTLRADSAELIKNQRGQSGLWGYAISGDLPIVLLQVSSLDNIEIVRQLVQAHAYWRLKGLVVDLVIWNEDHASYRQRLHDQILGLIASGIEASVIDRPGGIFVRSAEHISHEDRLLFCAVARAVISDRRGTLAEQLDHPGPLDLRMPQFDPSKVYREKGSSDFAALHQNLQLANGYGGFSADGREYVIRLEPNQVTPAPWSNVLANPQFGTVISESGSAYTWSENAHEFRLTPWQNDPVSDASGEAFYLRDEETGYVWSPTALPMRSAAIYVTRHGFGYSVFETKVAGIVSELWVYVALDASVKFSVLKVRNESDQVRQLSATGYVEWVLGDLRAKSSMHVNTEIDTQSGALYARNAYNTEFAGRVAFFDVDDPNRRLTGDRTEFLGRNGSMRNPAALRRSRLSGKVGAGLDPCGVIQVSFDLAVGQSREIVFRLGVGQNAEAAGKLVQRFRGVLAARDELAAVMQYWRKTLGAVQVETPDLALNVMANGWLLYQTLACRVWARSGYYQSGGAYGFRDQLQDVMALVHAEPQRVREHILLCASRQFREGDVQHWWHPPMGRGVRTRCSDDYLWLPLAVCRYVHNTGDVSILQESAHFLEGRLLNPDEESYYDLPNQSGDTASVYQHCVLAIEHGLRFGEHGLPLIGSGDWNDGMNLVGIEGKGESIWLGFFLCEVMQQFADIALMQSDLTFAQRCKDELKQLRVNLDLHGWDGEWYLRAYFDDGSLLGSHTNPECRIDAIAQSWSVISSRSNSPRSIKAMNAVSERLVRKDYGLIQLLDPPFSHSDLNPGYIRGYVPGVRENGGQYTHGAIWTAMAFAQLGDRERAWECLTMINPVNHALSAKAVAKYRIEPYVVAADVYALPQDIGRGGWSWYTGSAGWMYRLIVESLLGITRAGNLLTFAPCIPEDWTQYKIQYQNGTTLYQFEIVQSNAKTEALMPTIQINGENINQVALVDDQLEHTIKIVLFK